ncbi:hypothetical protein [Vulgatibacter incomptus]|uniref:Uncharacterized protein n=1 Tax=Vulgatibacter incomptus TaxID=1391653 RepID=A0A0K1PDA5_9BACT|nr:hypothetical protein [Vulgatibacter incomptus]AKU91482.1 hypothetical protein AKJ08_1869 [Vulgatibacter incomptus]
MRSFLRVFLLFLVLVAYGVEAGASQRHFHDPGERSDCAACSFQATPGTPPAATALEPPVFVAPLGEAIGRHTDPPPPLEPADVSFATSPPAA